MNNDTRIIRIEDKIDAVKDTLGEINVTLSSQHESLKCHMARTDALEAIVLPLHRQSVMLQGVLRLVGVLALIGGIAEGCIAILNHIGTPHP